MRPHCEARRAIESSLTQQGPAALVDVVQRTGVDYGKARQVLSDCVRSGALTYTLERRPHARRPVAVYEPSSVLDEMADDASWHSLAVCLTGWR